MKKYPHRGYGNHRRRWGYIVPAGASGGVGEERYMKEKGATLRDVAKKQIGIVVSFEEYDRVSSGDSGFMAALWQQVSEYGYTPAFFRAESMTKKPGSFNNHYYNGLFYVGMRQKNVAAISARQYLPAILIDCHYEDDLFFKLMPDYEEAVKLAMGRLGQDICVVMAYKSEVLQGVLRKYVAREDIYLYDEPIPTAQFHQFIQRNQGRGFLVIGDLLALYLKKYVDPRACLKIHSRHLHAPLCGIFGPNSGYIARYAPFIWPKSPTKCNAQLPESNFQTRSRKLLVRSYQDNYGLNADLCKVLVPVKQIAQQDMKILEMFLKLKDVEDIGKNLYFPPKFTYPKANDSLLQTELEHYLQNYFSCFSWQSQRRLW